MENNIVYSAEQKAIIDLACAPNVVPSHPTVRVTAAAGTGKTTTLQGFSNRLIQLGHTRITYVTFSKSAVEDAKKKMNSLISCSTIHGIALGLLDLENFQPEDESKLDDYILDMYDEQISEMLKGVIEIARNNTRSTENRIPRHKRTVAFYIRKTLTRFLQSADSIEKGFDPTNKYNTYYPAALWHQCEKVKGIPRHPGKFYVGLATKLFQDISSGKLPKTPFDFIIKKAQLEELQIPCDVLLIDESQDCTECQIEWLRRQALFGTQVVFVGDACQTIFGFRGAKSKFLMGLENCVDRSLTNSYRFGGEIASIANTILFVKENSPQTKQNVKSWIPYRVVGKNPKHGTICRGKSKYPEDEQITIIGRKNISLLQKSLDLLIDDPDVKIALNGKGSSGMSKWNTTLREVKDLYKLFMGKAKSLDHWPAFRYDNITTWDNFLETVQARELGNYFLHIGLIKTYEKNTMKVVDKFKKNVIDKKYSSDEATYLLTTVHAAKGLEWDNVEVLDDFVDLATYKGTDCAFLKSKRFEFDQKNWGDDLNLWYVALTRSRRFLCLPEKFTKLIGSFEFVIKYGKRHESIDEDIIEEMCEYLGKESHFPKSSSDVKQLYQTLLCRWKKEVGDKLKLVLELGNFDFGADSDDSDLSLSSESSDTHSSDNDSSSYKRCAPIVTPEVINPTRIQKSEIKKTRQRKCRRNALIVDYFSIQTSKRKKTGS